MKMKIVTTLLFIVLLMCSPAWAQQLNNRTSAAGHSFSVKGSQFLLDGAPFQIISGDMHYARVPRQYWRDRMRKMKAMGLNTLTTYVFWNLHEPEEGKFDFSGILDIAEYIRTAQQEGLWVILRPGPYVCSEWDFGGFPAWLLRDPTTKVRSTDPKFLKAAARYMAEVGRQLAPLEISRGGPIIMVQVENEYGSFGSDKTYLNDIRHMIRDAGFSGTLFTSDGDPSKLADGTLPDLMSVINFGAFDSPEKKFEIFDKFRQNVPRMCGEFWVGWFDAWGDKHHTVSAESVTKGLDWMLSHGISVNLYMFHGGSSFGWMNGANDSNVYTPDISSYDYDSPLDEAGRPTPKFFAIRDVIRRYLPKGTELPSLPTSSEMITIPRFALGDSASVFSSIPQPVASESPQSMEALGQNYGFTLYRARLNGPAKGELEFGEARDYVVVCEGSRIIGTADRRLKQHSVSVDLSGAEPLNILVENMGRVNFGQNMTSERKGISGEVSLGGTKLSDWDIYRLPMTDPSRMHFTTDQKQGPMFYRGSFELAKTGDTYLDMRGWGKGMVWVNGHNLGRYWKIGPQQSLFVPSNWLIAGRNVVIVLDLEERGNRSIEGITDLVFSTPGKK